MMNRFLLIVFIGTFFAGNVYADGLQKDLAEAGRETKEAIVSEGQKVGSALKREGKEIKEGVKKAAQEIGPELKKAGREIKEGAQKLGSDLKEAVK